MREIIGRQGAIQAPQGDLRATGLAGEIIRLAANLPDEQFYPLRQAWIDKFATHNWTAFEHAARHPAVTPFKVLIVTGPGRREACLCNRATAEAERKAQEVSDVA
jgi:hypothetical protein